MGGSRVFPEFPSDWEPTRATLHAYAHAVGAVPRAACIAHPKWWHISLKVRPEGLTTDPAPLPDGRSLSLTMDLKSHDVVIRVSSGDEQRISMAEGRTGTAMGDAIIAAASALGVAADYDRSTYVNDDPRTYDPQAASTFFDIVTLTSIVLEQRRAETAGDIGPVQLWPHGFDLAFEWFGTRTEVHDEHGERSELPSQINHGLYPAGEPYFYCNPWPFDRSDLIGHELTDGAEWHTEGWEGTTLPYAVLAGDPEGPERLLAFHRRVFELAAPLLTA